MTREEYNKRIAVLVKQLDKAIKSISVVDAIYCGDNEYSAMTGRIVRLVKKSGKEPYAPFILAGLQCESCRVRVRGIVPKKTGEESSVRVKYDLEDSDRLELRTVGDKC